MVWESKKSWKLKGVRNNTKGIEKFASLDFKLPGKRIIVKGPFHRRNRLAFQTFLRDEEAVRRRSRRSAVDIVNTLRSYFGRFSTTM
jgi:hypothetical protein